MNTSCPVVGILFGSVLPMLQQAAIGFLAPWESGNGCSLSESPVFPYDGEDSIR